jgi:hypothetical protein
LRSITIRDGSYVETTNMSCGYEGAQERRGTYEIDARRDGYLPASETGVVVTGDDCHVTTQDVTIDLQQDPSADAGTSAAGGDD